MSTPHKSLTTQTMIGRVKALPVDKISVLFSVTDRFSAAFMLLITISVFLMIVSREILGIGMPWLDDVSRYGQIWLVYLAAVALTAKGDHISIDAAYLRFPPLLQRCVRLGVGITTLAISLLIAYTGLIQNYKVIINNERSASGALPAYLGYGVMPISFVLIAIASVYFLQRAWNGTSEGGEGE